MDKWDDWLKRHKGLRTVSTGRFNGVRGGLVVSVQDDQIVRFGIPIPVRTEIWFDISALPADSIQLNYDEYTDRSVIGKMRRWERERTGHPSSYAEAKKMRSITLFTHGCNVYRVNLLDCSASSSFRFLTHNWIFHCTGPSFVAASMTWGAPCVAAWRLNSTPVITCYIPFLAE